MNIFKSIPLFGIVLVVYVVLMAIYYQNDPSFNPMLQNIFAIRLPSGRFWRLSVSDVVIIGGLAILFLEITKSLSSSDKQIIEHILSTFVFIFYVIAFLMAPMVAHSTFFILGVMSLIDVVAGFTISIAAARRDLSVN